MSTVRRFEDLAAWKLARELVCLIYAVTKKSDFDSDISFRDQFRRAAVSIVANVAEGFERGSDKQLIQFLYNARGSAGEVRSLLYVALDQGYLTMEEFQNCISKAEEVSKALFGFIRYLQSGR
ncbi:MAG: S23 ribosomal protein [Acetothermia bacterium 64_32]|nr:MAG: S23 ribosomal protein [Acetothermia bacterium 64_32]HAF71196.1 four helix bundle protein [Candidatus Acetothermia bacterium]